MRLNLDDGFARLSRGILKKKSDALVYKLTFGVGKGQEMRITRRKVAVPEERLKHTGTLFLFKGQANDADAAASGGRRDCYDRIFIAVHTLFLPLQ